METYTVGHVATLFQVDGNTIRRWCKEFLDYLSEDANPEKGKVRRFTEDDLSVFSLISAMQNRRQTFTDMHASLKSGTRGEIPKSPTDIIPARNLLALQVQELTADNDTLRIHVAQLETEVRMVREQLDKVSDHQRYDDLLIEIGSLRNELKRLQK